MKKFLLKYLSNIDRNLYYLEMVKKNKEYILHEGNTLCKRFKCSAENLKCYGFTVDAIVNNYKYSYIIKRR